MPKILFHAVQRFTLPPLHTPNHTYFEQLVVTMRITDRER